MKKTTFLIIFIVLWLQIFFFQNIFAQSNNPERTFEKAKEQYQKGNFKEAISDFSIANEMFGGHVESIFMLVKCKIALNDLEGALKESDNLIELEQNNASFYNNRGNLKDELSRPEDAIIDYDKAISLKNDYTDAYYNRGIAYYNLQEFEKAKKDFEFVVKTLPKDPECWYGLGLIHQKLKAKDEACNAFKNAKDLAHPEALKMWEENCK